MTASPATHPKAITSAGSAATATARAPGCQPNSYTNPTQYMNARPATMATRPPRIMPIRAGAATVRTTGCRPPSTTPVFQTATTVMPGKHPPITMPPRVQTATTPSHGPVTVLITRGCHIVTPAIEPLLCTMQVRAPPVTTLRIGQMPGSSILMGLVQTAMKKTITGLESAATAIRAPPHGRMPLNLIIQVVIRTATPVTLKTARQATRAASAQNATPPIPGALR